MKAVLLLVSTILFTLAAAKTELEYQSAWNDFVAKYNKSYSCPMETVNRYIIFKNNLDFVENFNNGPERTFQVAINKFADLTNTEFAAMYNGFQMDAKKTNPPFVYAGKSAAPSSWDWRSKGAVTPIKDQGQCGSCWAFSAVGSMEGCHFLTTGSLVSLSEQDLVDCSGDEGNNGCDGGLMDDAFQYVMDNKGIDKESCYPYTAEDGTCHYTASCCGSTVTSFSDVTPAGDETALLNAVYSAPTSVAIDASQSSFQLYSSGVYYEPDCSSQQLDHGVLAVGYGTSGGQDYWIVKNSWGTSWGMDGYIWMSRNKSNNCGIATMASLPHGCGNCK